jgi:hypothetical protein
MNTLDQKLYELFPTEDITLTDEFTWSQMTFKREPELYDVFKSAGEKCFWWNMSDWGLNITFYCEWRNFPPIRWYDPTQSLLKQLDTTKQDIINLFTS